MKGKQGTIVDSPQPCSSAKLLCLFNSVHPAIATPRNQTSQTGKQPHYRKIPFPLIIAGNLGFLLPAHSLFCSMNSFLAVVALSLLVVAQASKPVLRFRDDGFFDVMQVPLCSVISLPSLLIFTMERASRMMSIRLALWRISSSRRSRTSLPSRAIWLPVFPSCFA